MARSPGIGSEGALVEGYHALDIGYWHEREDLDMLGARHFPRLDVRVGWLGCGSHQLVQIGDGYRAVSAAMNEQDGTRRDLGDHRYGPCLIIGDAIEQLSRQQRAWLLPGRHSLLLPPRTHQGGGIRKGAISDNRPNRWFRCRSQEQRGGSQ
jgi:hypothetical protein